MIRRNPCIRCRYYISGFRCRAFRDGIPEDIQSGKVDHTQSYPGDRGFRFELFDGTNKDFGWLHEVREAQEEDAPDTPAR